MKLAFIVKNSSRNLKKVKQAQITVRLSQLFDTADILVSEYAGHSIKLVDEACSQYDYLIAAGGDGTLNEVINGCFLKQRDQLPVIGVLPCGTANDFIKSSGIKGDIEQLLHLIRGRSCSRIDIGRLQCFERPEGSQLTRYFINIADVGFGASVVQKVNRRKSLLGANITFVRAILEVFLSYKPVRVSIHYDDQIWHGRALAAIFANGKYFGSGLCIAPHAELTSNRLAITLVGNVSMKDFLMRFGQLKRCQRIQHKEAQYLTAQRVEISSKDKSCAVEADGEFMGYLPATFEVMPKAINLLMP